MERKIKKIVTGVPTQDGAGVKLTRVLGRGDVADFDPFLMLDAFDSANPQDYIKGFPWHPHRGIETVTYLIRGDIEHGDSLGNKGSIVDGSSQWMTAGSGIIHQEMPKPAPHLLGLQLWINLPKKNKMTKPAYRDIRPENIAKIEEDGATIGLISGEYKGKKAQTQGEYVKATLLDVAVKAGKKWQLDTAEDKNIFVYIVEGSLIIDGHEVPQKSAALLGGGDVFKPQAGAKGARFVLFAGKPLREPVAWGGPIVMNTQEELEKAFEELDSNAFIKDNHPKNAA
ncbi:MAG: pirin family protein [Elusimicrobiota bacterium]|jgi:redox-sensitive bicupin YhaK (pirin superfamily)|nr:pirin family protein [Elusimicrobiota bacterium]